MKRITILISGLIFISLFCGCALFRPSLVTKRTQITTIKFGKTTPVDKFKVGGEKPYPHIIWGDDIPDGSACKVTITNVSRAYQVYRYDFIYQKDDQSKGYNFFRGKIVELDPDWNNKIGRFVIELYASGRRVSTKTFSILP